MGDEMNTSESRWVEQITTELESTVMEALSDDMVTEIMRNSDGRL